MTVLTGQVKRCGALVGACVEVGSMADQLGGQHHMAVQGSNVQRHEAINVTTVDTESSSRRNGQLQDKKWTKTRLVLWLETNHSSVTYNVEAQRPSELERNLDTDTADGKAMPQGEVHLRLPPPHPSTPAGNEPRTHTHRYESRSDPFAS